MGENDLTREGLYLLVWETPFEKLAAELGISEHSLAKRCRLENIPRPPRDYWAKIEAGKRVTKIPLPRDGKRDAEAVILRAPTRKVTKRRPPPVSKPAVPGEIISIPSDLRNLHPRVAAWVKKHRDDLAARRAEDVLRRRRNPTYQPRPGADLTERDHYRFRVISSLLRAVEKRGGEVLSAWPSGVIKFSIGGETVELAVAEKMTRTSARVPVEERNWSAFLEVMRPDLRPTGFLRFTMRTHLGRGHQNELVETQDKMADVLLPKAVASIMAAGPKLVEERKAREERERRWEQERAEQAEQARLVRLDEERWARFRSLAADWEEARRLAAFIAALRERAGDLDQEVDGRRLRDWLAWADEKLEALDPMRRDHGHPFAAPPPTYRWR